MGGIGQNTRREPEVTQQERCQRDPAHQSEGVVMFQALILSLTARAGQCMTSHGEKCSNYLASLREQWRFLDLDHSARHEWLRPDREPP